MGHEHTPPVGSRRSHHCHRLDLWARPVGCAAERGPRLLQRRRELEGPRDEPRRRAPARPYDHSPRLHWTRARYGGVAGRDRHVRRGSDLARVDPRPASARGRAATSAARSASAPHRAPPRVASAASAPRAGLTPRSLAPAISARPRADPLGARLLVVLAEEGILVRDRARHRASRGYRLLGRRDERRERTRVRVGADAEPYAR